ncbi:hypothetical protein ElyMa_000309500 [Elysia marginata]|uniref:WSC domain-containing protein n=1 Tax=Elysia marginata TaxID=1093978 RepID=A0AAV4FBK2_9GAST|nr:hypothetical protein ElyMa_000309500 [Elysia marginata]
MALWMGCYHSIGDAGVFPNTGMVNLRSQIDWNLWTRVGHGEDIIKKCGEEALKKGVHNFGVEFYGECYFGDSPDYSQGKVQTSDGCDQHCKWDVGGPDTMVVYNLAWIDRLKTQ